MSVILYPSGVTETYEPKVHTFADEEILNIFNEFDYVRTARLYEIVNTWCVWGESENDDETNFNKLASDILEEEIFSHVLFIHDSEINPAWMLTDQIIYKGYADFSKDLVGFFDQVAESVIRESQQREGQGSPHLLFLNTIGPTEDKRVLFEFDPQKQSPEFFEDRNFVHFANKVREYLIENYKNNKIFVIYHDKKSIIYAKDEGVEYLIDMIIKFFQRTEKYEYCKELKDIYDKWAKFKAKPKPKQRKRKKEDGS